MDDAELRVAPHFPFAPPECRQQADAFFDCFSKESKQPDGGDADAARRGLASCITLMQPYDACMEKYKKQRNLFSYRVAEEYRKADE